MPLAAIAQVLAAAADDSAGATVAAACCFRLAVLVQRMDDGTSESDVGTLIDATVLAMRAHCAAAAVQSAGCEVIAFLCLGAREEGADAAVVARLVRALQVGGVEAVAQGMGAHADASHDVLQRGVMALSVLVGRGLDARALKARAMAAGARTEWLDLATQLAGGEAEIDEQAALDAAMADIGVGGGGDDDD